jgi:hypothetical protein
MEPLPDGEEAGLDLHDWETRFQQLEPDLETDPAQTLPDLADLVEGMLQERGLAGDELPGAEDEHGLLAQYRFAREIADGVERGDAVDPGDLGAAIESLRDVYAFLVGERRAP